MCLVLFTHAQLPGYGESISVSVLLFFFLYIHLLFVASLELHSNQLNSKSFDLLWMNQWKNEISAEEEKRNNISKEKNAEWTIYKYAYQPMQGWLYLSLSLSALLSSCQKNVPTPLWLNKPTTEIKISIPIVNDYLVIKIVFFFRLQWLIYYTLWQSGNALHTHTQHIRHMNAYALISI